VKQNKSMSTFVKSHYMDEYVERTSFGTWMTKDRLTDAPLWPETAPGSLANAEIRPGARMPVPAL
jgi:hypothetical protein